MTTVRDVPYGTIVETLCYGNPTGNIYKVCEFSAVVGKRYAWKAYRAGRVSLHASVECRVLTDTSDLKF